MAGCWKTSRTAKRYWLYVNVALFRLLVFAEYSVIIPTLWPYLSNVYGSSSYYYGLCLSGFHMTSLPSSLIFGFLNDYKFKLKTIVLFGNILQIVGSCLYLVRIEQLVLPSRCIVGIGASNSE